MINMKKCLSLLIALSMIASICVFPVAAEETATWYTLPEGAELILAEDFESGYDFDTNLLGNGTTTIQKNGKDALVFRNAGNHTEEKSSAKIIDATAAGFDGKALYVTSTNTVHYEKIDGQTVYQSIEADILLNGGEAVAAAANDRQIVIQFDSKIKNYKEAAFMKVDSSIYQAKGDGKKVTVTPYMFASGTNRSVRNGNYNGTIGGGNGEWYIFTYYSLKDKVTSKQVFDQTGDTDVVRSYDPATGKIVSIDLSKNTSAKGSAYAKDVILKDFVAEEWWGTDMPTTNMSDPTKLTSKIYSNKAGNAVEAYIDNILVYSVPSIDFVEIASKEAVNASKGIEVKFNVKPGATAESFKITDAEGNDVDATITDVEVVGNSAFLKVDGLADLTEYKLWIDDEFTSAAGALYHTNPFGINAAEEWLLLDTFTTNAAFKLVGEVEDIAGLIPNDPRNVEIEASTAIAAVEATLNGVALDTLYNGKVATLSFANIAAPKSGNVNVKLTSTDGQVIELTIPATAVASEITYIYNDNLEGYGLGNLITDGSGKNYVNGKFRFNTLADSLDVAGTAEITEDATQGKVLKFATTGKGFFTVTYEGDQSDLTGKVLVLRTKYYVPKNFTNTSQYGNYGAAACLAPALDATGNSDAPSYRLRSGAQLSLNSGNYSNNRQEANFTMVKDGWTDIITVLDYTTAGTLTDPHTSRRYMNGEINVVQASDQKGDATIKYPMYDTAPNYYRGTWDFSGLTTGYTSDAPSYHKFSTNKMYGTYTFIPNAYGYATSKDESTAPTPAWVMVDDFQAYIADKFQITSISENKDAFVPTRHTLKVVFNQPIAQDQADTIELYTAEGVKVEGLEAAIANGGYAIDFTLPAVDPGAYKLSISPAFHDARSYQGLGSKNHNYEIPVTVAEYVAFKAEVDNAAITGFTQGKSTKAVVTLTAKTSLVDSNAKTAFTVVNGKGVAVTDGWTADVADDQMSITLDFTDLETDSYTITSNEKLVDKDGFALDSDPVSITIAPRIDKIMLIDEDFEEGFELETDWLTIAPTHDNWKAGRTRGTGVDNDAIVITDQLPEGAADAGISGKAMRIYAEQEATKVTKGITAKYAIDPIDIENTYPGKLLVMEVDVYADKDCIADGSKPIIASFTKNVAPNNAYYKHNGNQVNKEGTWFSYGTASHAGYAWHSRWADGVSTKDDAGVHKFKFVQVIDQRNPMDVYKMYVNGKIAKEVSNTLLTDHPLYQTEVYEYPFQSNASAAKNYWATYDAGDFYGVNIVGQTYSSTAMSTDMYIDNIKVYLVDPFEITSVEGASTAFNGAKDSVKFNFTNKVDIESAKENIKLVDVEGNVVPNGLLFETAEGGYQLIAKLAAFENNATYKLVVSPYLKDEFGISIANKYKEYTYTSTGGSGYVVKHGASYNDKVAKYNGKDYAWVKTEEEANAIGGTKYPYTWTVAEGKVTAENPLKPGTAETFSADGWVVNKEAMKLETVIKLSKATSLYANTAAATITGNTVKTSLSFVNPEDNALPVWYIVAAYGDYNEMLGCKAASIEIAKGEFDLGEVSFEVEDASAIKSVKVYVWDGYRTMVPYQDAEELLK